MASRIDGNRSMTLDEAMSLLIDIARELGREVQAGREQIRALEIAEAAGANPSISSANPSDASSTTKFLPLGD